MVAAARAERDRELDEALDLQLGGEGEAGSSGAARGR
jgi:hypothetical protein